MGAGLFAVKSGFLLFIKDYQFSLQINTLERERESLPSFASRIPVVYRYERKKKMNHSREAKKAMVKETNGKTIFVTVFLPDGKHLLAADSSGRAYIWEVNPLLEASYWESVPVHAAQQDTHKPAPKAVLQLHDCAIFSVCLLSDKLLTGGDDCIKVWNREGSFVRFLLSCIL
jgi:WD40 repeat protein